MKTVAFSIIAIIAGIVCVISSEYAVVGWLNLGLMDITGNFFLLGVFPAHLVVYGIAWLALASLFRQQPVVLIALFMVATLVVYVALLNDFKNPPADIAYYVVSLILSNAIWWTINRKRVSKA